jgi:hypothetical protein
MSLLHPDEPPDAMRSRSIGDYQPSLRTDSTEKDRVKADFTQNEISLNAEIPTQVLNFPSQDNPILRDDADDEAGKVDANLFLTNRL